VPGDERPFDVREDRLAEPDDAGKPVIAAAHSRQQVLPDLLLDASVDVSARAKFAERGHLRMLLVTLHTSDSMSLARLFASLSFRKWSKTDFPR
jgi:hypothetical protein